MHAAERIISSVIGLRWSLLASISKTNERKLKIPQIRRFFFLEISLVGCWSSVFIRRIFTIYKSLNVCSFHYTAFVVSGKVGIPSTGLATPVGLLSLLHLTILNRSAIVVLTKVLVAFLFRHVAFWWFFFWISQLQMTGLLKKNLKPILIWLDSFPLLSQRTRAVLYFPI